MLLSVFPLESLNAHPPTKEVEFDEFDPEQEEPPNTLEIVFLDPMDRARFTLGYLMDGFSVPRVGMPDGLKFRLFCMGKSPVYCLEISYSGGDFRLLMHRP